MSDSAELKDTIEDLRAVQFPKIPRVLVYQILEIESLHTENRDVAQKKIAEIVGEYVQGAGAGA